MKIEINGFSIELTTDDVNLSLKVSDATGKELSNNTYVQEQTSEVTPVEVPSPENTTPPAETPAATTPEGGEATPGTETTPSTEVAPATEQISIPSFEEFKQLLKEGKIKPAEKKTNEVIK